MGELAEYLTMAFENIRHNKGRSFLTMLGIIIGIASVITITMVGNAFSHTVSDTLENIGGGQIFLYVGDDGAAADAWITPEDMSALGASDGVEGVTPFYSVGGSTETGKGNFSLTISGGTPILGKIQYSNMEIVKGRNISETDIENGSRICVMKRTDVQKMFGTDDVIGMNIPVTSGDVTLTYKIIGLLDTAKGEEDSLLSLMNSEEDVGLIVPFPSLADWGYDTESFTGAYVLCDGSVESGKVAEAALKLLNRRHQVPQKDNYFLVQNFTDTFDQMNSLMGTVTMFVMLVAAISLVVGGIGVMNIMLVSVTERTREIGIRKSIGATTASITLQFLAESAIIAVMGGGIGILAGTILSAIICAAIHMKLVISPLVMLSAAGVSMGIGMFFGIYPARKAAHLSPMECLRHE